MKKTILLAFLFVLTISSTVAQTKTKATDENLEQLVTQYLLKNYKATYYAKLKTELLNILKQKNLKNASLQDYYEDLKNVLQFLPDNDIEKAVKEKLENDKNWHKKKSNLILLTNEYPFSFVNLYYKY